MFVPQGPRALHLELGPDVIEVPIDSATAALRAQIGRMLRERAPHLVLSDAQAMDALYLRSSA